MHWILDRSMASPHVDSSTSSHETKQNDESSHSLNEQNKRTNDKLKNAKRSRKVLVNSALQSQDDPSTSNIVNDSSSARSSLNQSLLKDPSSTPKFNPIHEQDSSAKIRSESEKLFDKLPTRFSAISLSKHHRSSNSYGSSENIHRLCNSDQSPGKSANTRHTIGCSDLTHEKSARPIDSSNIQSTAFPHGHSTKFGTGIKFPFNHKFRIRN